MRREHLIHQADAKERHRIDLSLCLVLGGDGVGVQQTEVVVVTEPDEVQQQLFLIGALYRLIVVPLIAVENSRPQCAARLA